MSKAYWIKRWRDGNHGWRMITGLYTLDLYQTDKVCFIFVSRLNEFSSILKRVYSD